MWQKSTTIITYGEWINAILVFISIPLTIYFVKLEFMVKDLEKHPFLDGIKEENKQDAINAYKKEGQ